MSPWCYSDTMTDVTRMTIRLPDDLLARLRRAAERNRRSLHAEMLWRLENFGQDEDHGKDHDAT